MLIELYKILPSVLGLWVLLFTEDWLLLKSSLCSVEEAVIDSSGLLEAAVVIASLGLLEGAAIEAASSGEEAVLSVFK